ncbi:MAG: TonB family protein [Pyrinomonadaceae bacterium]
MKGYLFILLLSVPAAVISAQNNLGIINGTADVLPRPTYPSAAKHDCPGGKVAVEVLVGADGRVKKARAKAGHKALRAAAIKAARGARFRRFGPVQIRGLVVYTFGPMRDAYPPCTRRFPRQIYD